MRPASTKKRVYSFSLEKETTRGPGWGLKPGPNSNLCVATMDERKKNESKKERKSLHTSNLSWFWHENC